MSSSCTHYVESSKALNKAKCSKYPKYKFELISHLNIDDSEIFYTQSWPQIKRHDQVSSGSKHHLPIIIHLLCLCIRGISQ